MIIGLTGSFGAGKGAVVEYLVQKKGFTHYSASGFLKEEIVRRGIEVNRDSMIAVGNELRMTHGPSYIVDSLYERAQNAGGNAVIEALRATAEVQRVKELGGFVIGIDADPKLRYDRSIARGSEKDHVSFEKWSAQEKEESNATDPNKQNIFGSLKESNVVLVNNGSLEELQAQIESTLGKIATS